MYSYLKKILFLLSSSEKKQLYLLFFAVMLMAILEVVGVSSIIPFMNALTKPNLAESSRAVRYFYNAFGMTSDTQLKVYLGVFVIIALIASNVMSALTMWALTKFTWMRSYSVSKRLLKDYVDRPYSYFLNINTSDLSKNILSEVHQVVGGVFVPGMRMFARIVVLFFLMATLLVVSPLVTIVMMVIISSSYIMLYGMFRRKLKRVGHVRVISNGERFRAVANLFGGIRDIKILNREKSFLDAFSSSSKTFANCIISNQVIGMLPRYVMQSVVFVGVVSSVLYYFVVKGNISSVLPIMVFFAFACYRMMPAVQQIFESATKLRFNYAAVDKLYNDVIENRQSVVVLDEEPHPEEGRLVRVAGDIRLSNVVFKYPNSDIYAINNISLNITKNTTVALVGETGCGKTTLVDVIMGLLSPDAGYISVGDLVINDTMIKAWQKNIGYVPQNIYISDASVRENIAFGIEPSKINKSRVEEVANIANVSEFIKGLPGGYDTVVGERGIRLSGGQLQRIGIARALYSDPDVLIMDEATSALDGITEDVVMLAIDKLSHEKTIILIAHRITTVKDADKIYLMENGKIISEGEYQDMMEKSQTFRSMAKVDMSRSFKNRDASLSGGK
jgi:ATP-binding cassette, subfamily B, bacterial PglK